MIERLKPYLPQQIRVGGEIRHRMELTADKMLHHLDVEHCFVRHFRERRVQPEVPGGFSGYGMFLDAAVKAAAHGIGGDEMREFKEFRIAELISTQSEDGAITIFAGEPGFWDNHDQAYMIQAFVLDYRLFGTEGALVAAIRLGEFLLGRKTGVTLGLETAFLMLFEESGDRRFLDYCREHFKLEESLAVYDRMLPINGIAHVYTWTARVLAQLQYVQVTGKSDETLLEGAQELYRRVFEGGYSSISGSCSGGINWGELWDDSQTGLGKWGETCVSAYLLRCTAKMFEFDATSRYGDLYERIMYNAFFGAQSEDGRRQRYFIPFNEAGEWYEHETYCCPNNLRRMMFELPNAIWFETSDGIAINLYTESELNTPEAKIVQKTAYPESEEVELTVTAKPGVALYLRIPQWCERLEVDVENETLTSTVSGGWFRLVRNWQNTTLKLRLPMPVRLVRGTMAQAGRVAVMRGPLVYAVEQERNEIEAFQLDLLTIDNTRNLKPETGGIEVPCVIPNRTHPEKTVHFTRFSAEKRTRTYFPATSAEGSVDDGLYRSFPENT